MYAHDARRDEDLSDLRSGLSIYLPMIANGTLLADAVVRYAGQTMLLNAISHMSLDNQRQLLDDASVTVVVLDNGERREIERPLNRLGVVEIRNVFDGGRLRSTDEQFLLISRTKRTQADRPRAARLKFDKSGDFIQAGKVSISVRKVFDLLSDHFGVDVENVLKDAAQPIKGK